MIFYEDSHTAVFFSIDNWFWGSAITLSFVKWGACLFGFSKLKADYKTNDKHQYTYRMSWLERKLSIVNDKIKILIIK